MTTIVNYLDLSRKFLIFKLVAKVKIFGKTDPMCKYNESLSLR